MPSDRPPDITTLLNDARGGDRDAGDELWRRVYGELRGMARAKLAGLAPGEGIQATALVHDAFLKLGGTKLQFENRAHFYGAAARAMRNVLVDEARRRAAAGNRDTPALIADAPAREGGMPLDVLALAEALERLEDIEPRAAQVVSLRFFAGLTLAEVAQVLQVSRATVAREWAYSRAWLHRELSGPTAENRQKGSES